MHDLNDLMYFAKVVEHGGFMAAGRALGIPKSRLSRRVAELEQRLGARLLQRTTRRLALTEIGSQYYQHCQAMLAEAEAAHEAILQSSAEPRGLIRVSCPELLAKTMLSAVLPRFLALHPQVRVALDSTNRRVDLIEESVDVALRVRNVIDDSASLVVRRLGKSRFILVASPDFIRQHGEPQAPERLAALPALSMSRPDGRGQWTLLDNIGQSYTIHLDTPRLMTDDMIVLLEAAIAGVGVAALPANVCHQALADGRLRHILPQYDFPWGILHAAFPTRRGLSPAVRAFLDFIAQELISDEMAGDWGRSDIRPA
ncbi:LysR family transcriptional regulator [Chromobacterium subtsugae]|uniref:LysR family transcriptional regulator n=1 Tax=Chromobacterium subtsugae TaxID=251747 RepID=A0ABS7FJY5_9NEIS|nr:MULTISPECIES: LysR substrate-binding domain-containing protein [Chromobacterium]KUM03198.1 LysR family transcriptional regulator [Chromobacterium subtsugae]KZE88283.1 LysR family transcriptional regulator [Chromobacterium sp. F49]MBW7565536.1 LysR family transcriptional regulator [Chromobacterium subtsugae]MBW8290372.1 LysR family transcriptional regulator [Chromobacterium subtsugae]WSE89632.1 LysR substrate-binding domain-containing protein [Chromobacterium subtsugae]